MSTQPAPAIDPDALFEALYDTNLSPLDIAREHGLTLAALLDWAESPPVRARYQQALRLAEDRAALRAAEARISATLTLQALAVPGVQPDEPARKAAALLFRGRPAPRRADTEAAPSPPPPPPENPLELSPQSDTLEAAPAHEPAPPAPAPTPTGESPMPRRRSAIASAAAILLAAGAAVRAQPANDLCANAQPITGFGTFHLDNQNAGLDGLPNVPCSPSLQINRDLWFCWTAPATTQVRLSTCLLTSVNTSVAGYDGCGCPAVSLVACDDDNCDPQSRVAWSATAGQTNIPAPNRFASGLHPRPPISQP